MSKENKFLVESKTPLLEFLLEHVAGQSRNSVKHLLSRNQVLVNGTPQTRYDFMLTPGSHVTLQPQTNGPVLPFPILFEDENLLAVNKPAGLLSVATHDERERTAYRLTSNYVRGRTPNSRLFLVHRLDRYTSGVLLFAKNEEQRLALQDNWNLLVQKRGYYAVVEGTDIPDSGECRTKLRENRIHKVYSSNDNRGKEAITRYKVLARKQGHSLLDISLETGRKNQIRVHLSELGYPVVGDKKYGAAGNAMGRLGLHAYALALINPMNNHQRMSIIAPPPDAFRRMFPGFFH